MLALRIAHETARREGTAEADPTNELAALADEFPGALREIDRLAITTIEARIARLDGDTVEAWMTAQLHFHRYARSALQMKRWLAGRAVTPELRAQCPQGDFEIDAVANPPRGRVMDLVHARVAREMAITVAEARALVFG